MNWIFTDDFFKICTTHRKNSYSCDFRLHVQTSTSVKLLISQPHSAHFHVLWQTSHIANRTAVLFVELIRFSWEGRAHSTPSTWETLVYHQVLHPEKACKVNTQVYPAPFPASVTQQCQHLGRYMRWVSSQWRLRGSITTECFTIQPPWTVLDLMIYKAPERDGRQHKGLRLITTLKHRL